MVSTAHALAKQANSDWQGFCKGKFFKKNDLLVGEVWNHSKTHFCLRLRAEYQPCGGLKQCTEAGDLPQVILEINMCSVRCRSLIEDASMLDVSLYLNLIIYLFVYWGVYWIMIICSLSLGMHSHPSSNQDGLGLKVPTQHFTLNKAMCWQENSIPRTKVSSNYLEPVCPLFWGLNPPKEGPNSIQNKDRLGSRYIYIYVYELFLTHKACQIICS